MDIFTLIINSHCSCRPEFRIK